MEEIIDVKYKEVVDLESLTTEELKNGANLYWSQMELLGKMGIELAARAGKNLNIIKSRIGHGGWEAWCNENLRFSKRKAERMMKLARKIETENGVFANPKTLSDIEISKVWAILEAPEDVAEEVMGNPQAADMSVREFKEEVRRLKEEKQGLETELEAVTEYGEQAQSSLKAEIDRLKAEIASRPQTNAAELEAKEAELRKLQDKLTKEKEKTKKLKESVDAEKEKAAAEARAKAEEAAKAKASEDLRFLQESNREAAEEIDRLTRKLANNSNTEVATFKAYADQLQKAFGSCTESIASMENEDAAQAEKMRCALKQIMTQMIERI